MNRYYNKQKECPKADMNKKGFCIHGRFVGHKCICGYKKLGLYCPFAMKIHKGYEDQK